VHAADQTGSFQKRDDARRDIDLALLDTVVLDGPRVRMVLSGITPAP
jgi:hypothetical protein